MHWHENRCNCFRVAECKVAFLMFGVNKIIAYCKQGSSLVTGWRHTDRLMVMYSFIELLDYFIYGNFLALWSSGYDACLSRKKSRVRIPLGSPGLRGRHSFPGFGYRVSMRIGTATGLHLS